MKVWLYIKGEDEWCKNQNNFGTTNSVSKNDILIFFYPEDKTLGMYQVLSVNKYKEKMYDMLDYFEGTMERTLQPREFVEKYENSYPNLCAIITDIMINKVQKY